MIIPRRMTFQILPHTPIKIGAKTQYNFSGLELCKETLMENIYLTDMDIL